jgi:hypothetical protein
MSLNCASAGDSEQESEAGKFSYGKQGLQFDDGTGNNFLWFGVRLQTRWANERVTQDELPGAPVTTSSTSSTAACSICGRPTSSPTG